MATVPRASEVWAEGPLSPRKAAIAAILRESRGAARSRRERVLRYPWAAARLREIFGYKTAEQWNGYVPPARMPADMKDASRRAVNTSAQRAALIQLLNAVKVYEDTGVLTSDYAMREQSTIPDGENGGGE